MKGIVSTILLWVCVASAGAGPSSSGSFNPAILRQDFTGQGTYHRIGLVREQERAIAASRRTPAVAPKSESKFFLARLWQSLFPSRRTQSIASKP